MEVNIYIRRCGINTIKKLKNGKATETEGVKQNLQTINLHAYKNDEANCKQMLNSSGRRLKTDSILQKKSIAEDVETIETSTATPI